MSFKVKSLEKLRNLLGPGTMIFSRPNHWMIRVHYDPQYHCDTVNDIGFYFTVSEKTYWELECGDCALVLDAELEWWSKKPHKFYDDMYNRVITDYTLRCRYMLGLGTPGPPDALKGPIRLWVKILPGDDPTPVWITFTGMDSIKKFRWER